jgi:hypothetical protein
MGVVNNQTDSWKFKFEKLLNNATYEIINNTYCALDKTKSMNQVHKNLLAR